MKVKTKVIYVAHDGKEFETEEMCKVYEANNTIPGLRNIINNEELHRKNSVSRKNHLKNSTLPRLEKDVKNYSNEIDKAILKGAYKLKPKEIVRIRMLMNKLEEAKSSQAAYIRALQSCREDIRNRRKTILKIQNKINELEGK